MLHALYLGTRFFCYALFALSTGEHTESSAWEGFFFIATLLSFAAVAAAVGAPMHAD